MAYRSWLFLSSSFYINDDAQDLIPFIECWMCKKKNIGKKKKVWHIAASDASQSIPFLFVCSPDEIKEKNLLFLQILMRRAGKCANGIDDELVSNIENSAIFLICFPFFSSHPRTKQRALFFFYLIHFSLCETGELPPTLYSSTPKSERH